MAMMIWVKRSKGLATRFDPSRILYDPEVGIVHLAEAYNIDFDFTGAIFRRKGYEEVGIVGSCNGMFWAGGDCVLANNSKLSILADDLSTVDVKSDLADKRLSACQVGDAVLWMNGVQSGVVRNGRNADYVKPPETYYPDQTRKYISPPVGSIVRSWAGRIWVADKNTLWYSDAFAPNLFRKSGNYVAFPSRIIMVAPVLGGLFISTTSKIYFMRGTDPSDPNNFMQTVVSHYPAVEGTDCEVDGIAVGGGKISPLVMQMFVTTKGICVGTAEGELKNLTYETLEYPNNLRTGSAVFTGNKYIACLGSGSDKLTLCVSLDQVAVSQYANYDFEMVGKFGEYVLGGNSTGLYSLLTGDLDAGELIDAHFRTGPTDFGAENEKRIRKIYSSLRCTGRLKFALSADGKDDVVREVTLHDTGLKIVHQEVSGGRDIRGKHLDLKVSNLQGADFTITEIRALMLVLGNKTTEVM